MAFTRQANNVPTSIGRIVIRLVDGDGTTGNQRTLFKVQVLNASGDEFETLTGNLVPHLTGAQITAIQDFLDDIRTQAENEILPT